MLRFLFSLKGRVFLFFLAGLFFTGNGGILHNASNIFVPATFAKKAVAPGRPARHLASSSPSPSSSAEGNVCSPAKDDDDRKTVFCFFSLNNIEEFNTFEGKYGPGKLQAFKEEYGNVPNVEVKEFYGADNRGKSVEDQFKAMLKEGECDSLIISGHHTGYFTGGQSRIANNPSRKLNLDFMEDLSCEEGCADWFANVKSMFLMGCQTVKSDRAHAESPTADEEAIRIANEKQATGGPIHINFNQAYSSTLDRNNKLSHRYLRMFPNSSLYGWGGKAPTVCSHEDKSCKADESLPDFINLVNSLSEGGEQPTGIEDMVNFIGFMNTQARMCHQDYLSTQWVNHWTESKDYRSPTACYLTEKSDFRNHQQLGCNLTRALKNGNKNSIKGAVKEILDSGLDGIKANFNRLMSLIINEGNKDKSWYNDVVLTLKGDEILRSTLVTEITGGNVGFTRKADYLYFYKEMGWEDNSQEIEQISEAFLRELQKSFDKEEVVTHDIKEGTLKKETISKEVKVGHRFAIFNSIDQNNLGGWLSLHAKMEYDTLKNSFITSSEDWDKMRGHYFTYLSASPTDQEIQSADKFLVEYITQLEENTSSFNHFKGEICQQREKVANRVNTDPFNCEDIL